MGMFRVTRPESQGCFNLDDGVVYVSTLQLNDDVHQLRL